MRVTVCAVNVVPANSAVAIQPPIRGVELAILIPMVAAPKARLSQGKIYPENPKKMVKNIKATPMSQFSSRGFL